jgi:hypothetical protein
MVSSTCYMKAHLTFNVVPRIECAYEDVYTALFCFHV